MQRYPCICWIALVVVVLFSGGPIEVQANDFSSFLTANASLAVVVDRVYMQARGLDIFSHVRKILSDVIRENLKNGGINIKYYTWNQVRLRKDFLAALTITDCESTWNFYEGMQANSILLIAITDADCPRLPLNRALMVPLVERGDELSQMVLDTKVQQLLKWKTAIVLLDQSILTEDEILVKSVVQESVRTHTIPISLVLYRLDDTLRGQTKRNAIRHILAPFSRRPNQHQQFLVFSKFYEDIIEIGDSLNLFHIYNQWLFFVLDDPKQHANFDASIITANLEEGANIAFALNRTQHECKSTATLNCTIAELSTAFVSSISRMIAEEQSIYNEISDEEWESIRLNKREKQDQIINNMRDFLKANSKCASCIHWTIQTTLNWGKNQEVDNNKPVYRESRNKNFEFIDIGYWNPLLGYVTQELVFPHAEHKFRNITLNVITVHNPPWQVLKKNSSGSIVEHSGIVIELLKQLSQMLNFTYVLHEVKTSSEWDLSNREQNDTDNLVGSLTYIIPYEVIKMVQGNRFFLAAVASTIDEVRKQPFNYTIPISVQKYSFISRKPDEISRIYLFTAPFTLETWGSLVGAILITAPMLYVINRFVPMHHMKVKGLGTIKNCFWYIYGALLQQGGMYLPVADSARLIIGVWWIVVIVLVTTYCGNLVAFLTFPKFQPTADYFYQLFKTNEKQFGLRNGTFFEKYAAISTRSDYHRYLESAIIYNNAQEENIAAVEEGNRINVDWRINLQLIIQKYFQKDKECKFILGKDDFVDEQIGLIMPTNSPYLHLINDQIKKLFRMGFIEHWHKTNLPLANKCNGPILRQITNHKVNLEDMQGCFLVLLLGFMIALFVIFVEFWYHRLYVADKIRKTIIFTS